jgi:hypothetical protein
MITVIFQGLSLKNDRDHDTHRDLGHSWKIGAELGVIHATLAGGYVLIT